MIPSKKFTLSLRDFGQAFIQAFIAATLVGLATSFEAQELPSIEMIKFHIGVGLTTALAHIIRKYLSNSEGKILKKEPKSTLQ